MTEINSLAPSAAAQAPTSRGATSGESLRLSLSAGNLLPPGASAQADVLEVRQLGQSFQLLLRLTLANGTQTQTQALANQPLTPGTQLTVSQVPGGQLATLLQAAGSERMAPLLRLDTRSTPVGSLVQGQVVSSEALPTGAGQPAVFRMVLSLLGSQSIGTLLSIESPRPLAVGSLLTAQVLDDQSLRFVPTSDRQAQPAVTQQLLTQQGRQASLDGLAEALQRLSSAPDTAPALRSSVERLLASLPDVRQLGDGKAVAQALADSGTFLEAKLGSGQPTSLGNDLKANLLRLLDSAGPGVAANLSRTSTDATLNPLLPGLARAALGMLGNATPRPQPGSFPLPSRLLQGLAGDGDLEHLLRLAAAAVSRLQSHQLSSLQQTGLNEDGKLQSTWQSELYLRHGQAFVPVQVKLQHEQPADTPNERQPNRASAASGEPLWRIELAFDLHPLGPLQVTAQLSQGRLSGQLWAEQPSTAQLLASQLDDLRARLVGRGLEVGELNCHAGTPPQGPRTRLDQRWVDETA